MATVEVQAGVCGLWTRIVAVSDEAYNVTLEITSDCNHIGALAERLTSMSAFEELGRPIDETTPYRVAAESKTHIACPVPSAILKAMEVAAGLASPLMCTSASARTRTDWHSEAPAPSLGKRE